MPPNGTDISKQMSQSTAAQGTAMSNERTSLLGSSIARAAYEGHDPEASR